MKALLTLTALAFLLMLPGCKKEEVKPTETERVTEILTKGAGNWTPSASAGVTVDGVDVTQDLFKDFTITFTATQILTTGKTPVFLRQDTWQFKDNTAKVILRGMDNKEIIVESITENELQLSLEWDQTTYEEDGRSRSIPGKVVFTMNK
jgi:hypothetical protein